MNSSPADEPVNARLGRGSSEPLPPERVLLYATHDAAILLDARGRILALNEPAVLQLGQTPIQVIGLDLFELFPPEVATHRREWFRQVMRTRKAVRFADCHKGRALDNIFNPVFDVEGRVMQVACFLRDVTEERQREAELHESLVRLQDLESMLNQSPAMIFRWRVAPGWPVAFVSENVSQLGYRAEEFLSGMVSYPGITHPEDLPRLEDELTGLLANNQDTFRQQYRLFTKAGETRWMEDCNVVIRNAKGEAIYIQAVVLDITERKQAEAEREGLIQQLQVALQEVKTLSGLLPICASCKKIRDERGAWQQLESYIQQHSQAEFTHGICPACAKQYGLET